MGKEESPLVCLEQHPSGKFSFMARVDSGLVVVVTILVFIIGVMIFTLVYVKYERCHVLFKDNTVKSSILTITFATQENPACSKSFVRDNILLAVVEDGN